MTIESLAILVAVVGSLVSLIAAIIGIIIRVGYKRYPFSLTEEFPFSPAEGMDLQGIVVEPDEILESDYGSLS